MINLLKIEWSFTSSNTSAFMETLRLNLGGQVQAPPLKTLAPIISVFFTEQKAEELQAENMFIVNASTAQVKITLLFFYICILNQCEHIRKKLKLED